MSYLISAKKGNLLNEKSDFLVNPSNTKLILGSGVSLAFKRKCGIKLQIGLDSILNKAVNNELKQGDVVITSSYDADNFKYALHAAVMNYNQGVRGDNKKPKIDTIHKILYNIEKYLIAQANETNRPTKVAIPLIGCGVGGLDKKEVLSLYKDFFMRDVEMECNVVVYGYSENDYNKILDILG